MNALSASQSHVPNFDQRVEDRLQIEGRAADDFQHVGRRCLLLEGVAQLVEQARRSRWRLRPERRNSVTSAICLSVNGLHFLPVDDDGADQHIVLEHRHANVVRIAPRRASYRAGDSLGEFRRATSCQWTVSFVRVTRSSRPPGVGRNGPSARLRNSAIPADVPTSAAMVHAAVEAVQCTEIGVADSHRILQHGLENRLQLAGRAGDHAQNLRGSCLLLQIA